MRKTAALAGLVLGAALTTAIVTGRGGASITAGDGPFSFAESVTTAELVTAWTPKNSQRDGAYWARADCFAIASTVVFVLDDAGNPQAVAVEPGSLVYAQYADLTPPITQSGFTFGPTPSWSGGGADCTVRLYAIENGAFGKALATDSFG